MQRKKHIFLVVLCLVLTCSSFAQETPSAQAVVKEATTQASVKNKQVFLVFHASWCGWCHMMDSLLTKTPLAKTFNKHFVLAHITIMEQKPERRKDENPGGMDLFAQYGGSSNAGIPYWVVLDKDGKCLANSRMKGATEDLTGNNGDNTGCPGEPQEVAYFTTVLKQAAHFSSKEIEEVKEVFGKK